jgi:hypothetical protein
VICVVGERGNGREKELENYCSLNRHHRWMVRLARGAFRGESAQRFLELGLRWEMSANLLADMPADNATWDHEDEVEARHMANQCLEWAKDRGDVALVLAGQRVARSFELPYLPLSGHVASGVRCLVMPHPSGRCRWWNSTENTEKAGRNCLAFTADYGG